MTRDANGFIIEKGWVTDDDGNHIYIDGSGNVSGGAAAYSAYQQDTGGRSSGGNTATRGHRKEVYTRNGFLNTQKATEAVMEDTGLTAEEAAKAAQIACNFTAPFVYNGADYREIRSSQFKGTPIEEAEKLEEFIKLSPKWGDGELYRGICVSKSVGEQIISDAKSGKEIDQRGTSSWSSSEKEANNRATSSMARENVGIIFRTTGTSQGTSVRHLSRYPEEDEVVISCNARWTATKVTEAGKISSGGPLYIVDVDEL